MKCAICPSNAIYKVFFAQTGKLVAYCAKHGEFYIRLQMREPTKYKVYQSKEFTHYTNRIKRTIKSMLRAKKK